MAVTSWDLKEPPFFFVLFFLIKGSTNWQIGRQRDTYWRHCVYVGALHLSKKRKKKEWTFFISVRKRKTKMTIQRKTNRN